MNEIYLKKAMLVLLEENSKCKNEDYRFGYNRALYDVLQSLEVIKELNQSTNDLLQ